ncbi:hypothetical protein CPB86DRAFT_732209 [Serendipita vermifera]|nr:hypothetical protein CPB86DRAFT_732209 [Serendipita vermifera]
MEPRNVLSRKDSDQASSSRKRLRADDDVEPSPHLPSNDRHAWYYPGLPVDVDEDELPPGAIGGNWGKKHKPNARFVRRGHIAAWGPIRDEYDVEERARKRLRAILPEFSNEPIEKDPILPHLRSPSPPMIAPYPPAPSNHTSYTASIFDPNIGASFRSNLLSSLERSASELIQSEIALTRALGRFWTALTESANKMAKEQRHEILKDYRKKAADHRGRMDIDNPDGLAIVNGTDESTVNSAVAAFPPIPDQYLAELDSCTTRNVIMRMFTLPSNMRLDYTTQAGTQEVISVIPQHQVELVTRSMHAIRELQEDSKECMERLEEIREMLGKVKGLRDAVWAIMRSRAIAEMENEE